MDRPRQQNRQRFEEAVGSSDRVATADASMPTFEDSARRRHRRGGPTVSWYGRLLIVGALLTAAGWEIFRLLLTIITLD